MRALRMRELQGKPAHGIQTLGTYAMPLHDPGVADIKFFFSLNLKATSCRFSAWSSRHTCQ